MIEENNHKVFNEPNLKNAIFCALLMSSIDGEIHEKEWEIIQKFADLHWRQEYQRFEIFKEAMEKEIEPFLEKKETSQDRLKKMIEELTGQMNSSQKDVLLKLVGDVMAADGVMTLEESKLFALFMDEIGIRYT